MKDKFKKVWVWLRENILNKDMVVYVLIAMLIFWLPVIVCGVLALVVSPWWWTIVSAIILFWNTPFTPAIALQLGLAVAIKKVWEKIRRKKIQRGIYERREDCIYQDKRVEEQPEQSKKE